MSMSDLQFRRVQLRKAATGIDGLDAIMEGGLPAGRPTLLCGAAGCGKTLFGVTFLVEGSLRFGEPGVLMSFEERPQDISENVASLGYDLPRLVAEKKLFIDQVHNRARRKRGKRLFRSGRTFCPAWLCDRRRRRKTGRARYHRKLVRGPVRRHGCTQRASPPVHMAQGKRRHRNHHRRTWRGSADAPRAGGVCVRLRRSS